MSSPPVPTAREIMVKKIVTLRPEMPGPDAAEILIKNRISGAPVVDANQKLLGLLSEFDCLRAVASAEYQQDLHDAAETVGDLMTTACHTVGPDLDLFGIAHTFVRLGVRRLPVVLNGRLLGQVSRRDALAAALDLRRRQMQERRHYPDYPAGRDPIRDYPR